MTIAIELLNQNETRTATLTWRDKVIVDGSHNGEYNYVPAGELRPGKNMVLYIHDMRSVIVSEET